MIASYAETETQASRVLYINSKDATTTFNNNTSDFEFVLEEPIVIPEHHSIVMSIYSAEIPYSFYNFRLGVNCRIDVAITAWNQVATYDANGFMDLTLPNQNTITIPEGNYNAVQLANELSTLIGNGCEITFDPIALKFRFRSTQINTRITLAMRYGASIPVGNAMNEELGWDSNGLLGDPWFEHGVMGFQWWYGFSQPAGVGPGVDVSTSGPFLTSPSYFMLADDVCDMTNSIRSLFIRTNLSTSSVLDSHIGGGFSNILCRVPINAEPGGIINILPHDGDIHKLLLKVKAITAINMRLTNQENQTLNLNGLNFDISLKMEFIESKDLKQPPSARQILDQSRKEAQLKQENLKQEITKKTKKKSK